MSERYEFAFQTYKRWRAKEITTEQADKVLRRLSFEAHNGREAYEIDCLAIQVHEARQSMEAVDAIIEAFHAWDRGNA